MNHTIAYLSAIYGLYLEISSFRIEEFLYSKIMQVGNPTCLT